MSPTTLLCVWVVAVLICIFSKMAIGPAAYNNFLMFRGVAYHLFASLPLFEFYPAEYLDINHYGPFFAFVVAPFAWLPDWLAVPSWVLALTLALYFSIRSLPVEARWKCVVMWIVLNDLFCAGLLQQFNIAISALLVGAFVMLEKRREGWAALFIVIGTFVKVYGLAGLALFFFVGRKGRFIFFLLLWSAVAFLLPMLFVSPEYLLEQYRDWFLELTTKNADNRFAFLQNVSVVGIVRKLSGSTAYSDMWLILPALGLLGSTCLRRSQFRWLGFRMMMLALLMIFIVIFSSGSENSGYIVATVGVGIWWIALPRRGWLAWTLLALVLMASFARQLFPTPIYRPYIMGYAFRALPYLFVWLHAIWQMWRADFTPKQAEEEPEDYTHADIDVVLPCYNPDPDWVEHVVRHFEELQRCTPGHRMRLFVSNDGSARNFDQEHFDALRKAVPDVTVIDNKVNRGKGAAVRAGVARTTAPLVVYTDYDFPYRIECVCELIGRLDSGRYDIVLAARNQTYHRELSHLRKLLSMASRNLNRIVLGMPYPDAQGGLKGFNRKGRELFLSTRINQFLFDTEFIYKASLRPWLKVTQIEAVLRAGVHLPGMSRKTMRREAVNFLRIVLGV